MAYLVAGLVFAATLLQHPTLSAAWLWDSANALGYLAYAGLLYLFIEIGASRRSRVHQLVSYAIAAMVAGHILLLWVPDPTVWHYAAWQGPNYMWAGMGAAGLIGITLILALPATRRRWHDTHGVFRTWHYGLSLCSLGAAFWHIAGSGFYVTPLETWVLGLLSAAMVVAHRLRSLAVPAGSPVHLIGAVGMAALFVVVKL